ncbi:HAMP domain-containing sensor histidine kinase [Candidatus Galacturonibacter soehngenii]|uniref:histidine kinase n=1 Tax=Candidatus Galacturonatibacter soehngenii TaxID=2307010 RepID=A0A7V7UAY7_9FIRM|nr:HAMP domain-containing sensor histidine kinase [Candidatus Galacturonibacter soehngenii]KAB1435787.1 HAMP domain-containing histidine kinase [Candidatus Galacturonibacter soehngenii]
MKRIVYSNVTKFISFLLLNILVMTTLAITLYGGNITYKLNNIGEILSTKTYLESQDFRDMFIQNISNANYFIEVKKALEVAGEYNGNKEVSLSEFISDESNISLFGLEAKYKLQDLVDWGQEGVETATLYEVLEERMSTDNKLSTNNKLSTKFDVFIKAMGAVTDAVVVTPEEENSDDSIEIMLLSMQSLGFKLSREDLNKEVIREKYSAIDIDTILMSCLERNDFSEIEKSSYELQEAIETIRDKYDFYKRYETYFNGLDSTNFKIYIKDYKGDTILNNCIDENTDYRTYFDSKTGIIYNALNKEFTFINFVNEDINLDTFKVADEVNYIYAVGVDTNYPHRDVFFEANETFYNTRNSIIASIVSSLIIFFCFVYLVTVCGRSAKDDEIHLNSFDKMKTEVSAGFMIAIGIVFLLIMMSVYNNFSSDLTIVVGLGIETALFTFAFLSLVRRIKAGVLWKNSIVYSLLHWLVIFIKYRKATTKTIVLYLGFLAVTLVVLGIGINSRSYMIMMLWFSFSAVVGFFLLREAVARQTILNGIKEISNGDLEYKIDTINLSGSNEILADAINNIGEGLHNAVDASVRNERLKTDLITNVSHDIKTPLTSIINYVDLIKRENIENEKIRGYIEILDNKSQRLKNLTEDLVEASKISSGNIKLEMTKINFVELVNQTEGEFSEKLENKNLQIIRKLPEEPIFILADGRRMWRVIENLYNNVTKYAMKNTRVYVDVKADEDKVILSIKNISENPLNIDAEELTERFIRGDVSRSTEGSGLGLSIAKNLTTLQKGDFEIYLDGDLFRVTITFPRVYEQVDNM